MLASDTMNGKDHDSSTRSSTTNMPTEVTKSSDATYQVRTAGSILSSSPAKNNTAARSTALGQGEGGTDTANAVESASTGRRREHSSADDATIFGVLESDGTGKQAEISTPPAMERNLFLSALANGKFAVREIEREREAWQVRLEVKSRRSPYVGIW